VLFEPLTPQQRLRATRIAVVRDVAAGEPLAEAALGSRVAWVVLSGEVVVRTGTVRGPGALLYPEALLGQGAPRRADALAVAVDDVRVLAMRGDDFAELAGEDADLAEPMYAALARLIAPA
jgi:CRP-like cAMP-binding protein